MTPHMPDEPAEFVPGPWSRAVKFVSGRYYHPALDMASVLAAFFAVLGVYGAYADVDGWMQALTAAVFVLAIFVGIAIHDERRWRA